MAAFWTILPLVAALIANVAWRIRVTNDEDRDDDDKKGEYRAVRAAMVYIAVALLLYVASLIWAPPFAWWVNTIIALLAWVLALFSVLAVIDLPESMDNLHNWLWNKPGEASKKNRVKRVRKFSFLLFVGITVVSWVLGIVLVGLAGLSMDNGSNDPGQRSPGSSQSADPSTSPSPTTSPSTSAPNCGAPELRVVSTEAMKDTRFSPLGVERCVDGRWEDWGTSSAPDTIRIHRENWNSDGYYYFLFSHDGENVVARTKATR